MPAGKTLVVTCTAPIRQDSKTGSELAVLLSDALARGSARLEFEQTINGNGIRARLVKRGSARSAVVGFVHNPEVDPESLLTESAVMR